MELLKVLDENGNETGEILDRELVHSRGLWHREAVVWIFNSKGETLLQRRSKNKKMAPGKLALCAGHIESRDDSLTTAKKELFEELGIDVDKKDIIYLITEKKEKIFSENSINRIFNDIYHVMIDKNISEFKIQEEELSEVIWINYLELKKRIANHDDELVFKFGNVSEIKTFELLDSLYSKITSN